MPHGSGDSQPQCSAHPLGRAVGPHERVLEQVPRMCEVVAQAAADQREVHGAGGALEQGCPGGPFQLLDDLADPGLGDVQPLGRPPEVELVRQCQKDLYVSQFQVGAPGY